MIRDQADTERSYTVKEKKNNPEETAQRAAAEQAAAEEAAANSGPDAPEEEADRTAAEAQQMKEQIAQMNDRLLRTAAEFDNFRKRTAREKEALYSDAKADTVERFLPVYDNFERALENECADAEFKKGVEMIFHLMQDAFEKLGVTEVGAVGELFDPTLHNAVMHAEDEARGENEIVAVFQKGYKIGDKVIRHAMVSVAN